MSTSYRPYRHPDDYTQVSRFLINHHQPGNLDGNWLEPAWEYMHAHPFLDLSGLHNFGIWETGGEIAGVVHYEWQKGEAFFQFHPDHRDLRAEMLDHAETHLAGYSETDGRQYLQAYVNDNDADFVALIKSRGYHRDNEGGRPLYRFDIPDPFPASKLPEGFRLLSLAEDNNWEKVNRVMWRGFNHPGDPPATPADLEARRRMFDTRTARRDLKIIVAAPNGKFASICGMFYEPLRQFAYVEPVATDPAYRGMGLATAAVLEGIRRCAALGANVAYVGSDQSFYKGLGFYKVHTSECWVKRWG